MSFTVSVAAAVVLSAIEVRIEVKFNWHTVHTDTADIMNQMTCCLLLMLFLTDHRSLTLFEMTICCSFTRGDAAATAARVQQCIQR